MMRNNTKAKLSFDIALIQVSGLVYRFKNNAKKYALQKITTHIIFLFQRNYLLIKPAKCLTVRTNWLT